MKTTFALLAILLFSISSLAQNGINYKAVIKDSNGNVVANQTIDVQFIILQGATNAYQETHSPTTDDNGIVIVNIGEGTTSNVFTDIDWISDRHFLNVQIDIGSGLTDLGTTEFKTVPYALNVTGLEKIAEGFSTGWRLTGKDPENYGNIGINAVDLSTTAIPNSTYGATGGYSLATGDGTTASGPTSTAMGRSTTASGSAATALGVLTNAEAFGVTVLGKYNIGGGEPTTWVNTDPVFEVGIGASGNNRANALTILKNGTITAPSLTNALIDTAGDKALITKEYLDGNSSSGLEAIDEGNGIGWRLKGRDPNHYGNIGENAVDFSNSILSGTNYGATGNSSFVTGQLNIASGAQSIAMGGGNLVSGTQSAAIGVGNLASGPQSIAMGGSNVASGFHSTAMGQFTRAESTASTSLGRYNIGGGDPIDWVATDPLFEIGNSQDHLNRSNALTVLKNGATYIAGPLNINDNTSESAALRVNGAEAIWYNGTYFSWGFSGTANYFQDNVGIGITNPNAQLDVIGNIEYTGTIIDVSDERLKENFKPIKSPLSKLELIQGFSYNMIDDVTKKREYGVVAQEVQKVFPEMVSVVDAENGYLGVSYIQLIPVLLEAIKEQQQIIENQNKNIQEINAELSEQKTLKHRMLEIEALLKTKEL